MNRQDLTLLTDFYELTMMQGYYERENRTKPLFSTFSSARILAAMPDILSCAGLEQVIDYVKNLNFTYEDVDYLSKSAHFQ